MESRAARIPLVPKLLLRNTPVLEAPLPCARHRNQPPPFADAAKQSFGDKRVPKLELGNEGRIFASCPESGRG